MTIDYLIRKNLLDNEIEIQESWKYSVTLDDDFTYEEQIQMALYKLRDKFSTEGTRHIYWEIETTEDGFNVTFKMIQ